MTELFRVLAALAEPPTAATPHLAEAVGLPASPTAAEHTDLFVFQLPPYASIYLGSEGMIGGDGRDRIAGFWRALGATPPAEADHLVTLLAAYADLLDRLESPRSEQQRHQALAARRAFLWEHLLSWLPAFLIKAQDVAPASFRRWAELLREALREEARQSDGTGVLPLPLREAPPLQQEDLIPDLLVPVRSGVILTRADVIMGARSLDLGIGMSDRRRMLRAMLEQDAARTLGWLADEATRWARRHGDLTDELGPVAAFWQQRAEATRDRLGDLLDDLLGDRLGESSSTRCGQAPDPNGCTEDGSPRS